MIFWAQSTDARRIGVVGLVALCALICLGGRAGLERQVGRHVDSASMLERELLAAQSTRAIDGASQVEFVQRLHESSSVDSVIRELQRSGAPRNVAFTAIASSSRAATLQTLGRTSLTIALRGTYPDIKKVLAESFDRSPYLALQRVTLRRVASPTDLEGHIDLLLVSKPLSFVGEGG